MPSKDKHSILLNLEPELHAQITSAAKTHSVSNSEYIRQAIKLRLEKRELPANLPLLEAEELTDRIQTPDKPGAEYWLERIRQWAGMDGHAATASLLQSTGGVMPPPILFGSANELAKWLTENASK